MIGCQQPQAHPARCGCEQAISAAVLGAQNVNAAMRTIDELRQQLADVSHERDLLRDERDILERFTGYLLDHCEGQIIYEENLQYWLACSIKKHAAEKKS